MALWDMCRVCLTPELWLLTALCLVASLLDSNNDLSRKLGIKLQNAQHVCPARLIFTYARQKETRSQKPEQ